MTLKHITFDIWLVIENINPIPNGFVRRNYSQNKKSGNVLPCKANTLKKILKHLRQKET